MKLFESVTSIVQFNKFFTTFLLPMFGVSSFRTGNFKERLEDEAANVIAAVNFSSGSIQRTYSVRPLKNSINSHNVFTSDMCNFLRTR